jgi:hypothetical protein
MDVSLFNIQFSGCKGIFDGYFDRHVIVIQPEIFSFKL